MTERRRTNIVTIGEGLAGRAGAEIRIIVNIGADDDNGAGCAGCHAPLLAI
ncbi:MAG: hypothetical protein OXC93_09345 [Rhodospirillaceae bacterium]|nr:hypothetical protein [Rhodospirillaceae bacterium]